MSLKLLAKQMEAKGRGGDSLLVHMTPGEVEGLQKLAESAGGTLTVNPETGLVEANFLKSILPAVVPIAATYFGGPAAGAAAGALMGGGSSPAARAAQAAQGGVGSLSMQEEAPIRRPYETDDEEETYPYGYKVDQPMGAAQGGLMYLAEGGETAAPSEGMSGESAAAFDYLMGAAPTAVTAPAAQAPAAQTTAPATNQMFSFDPATGTFTRNPNYVSPSARNAMPAGLLGMVAGGDSGYQGDGSSGAPFDSMSDSQKAEFYSQNPGFATATQYGQRALDFLGIGALQDQFNPGYAQQQRDLTEGIVSGYDDSAPNMAGMDSPSYSRTETDTNPAGIGGQSGYGVDSMAKGGLLGLAKGGMASGGFVVPADVVSALGNGSTDAGLRKLHSMMGQVKPIKGKGDGLSDSIPTNIDGKQRAKVADGEAYIDPKTVKRLGGAKKLYAMMDKVRAQAHGKTSQQRPVNPAKVLA